MFGEYPFITWPGRFIFTAALALAVLTTLVKLLRLFAGKLPQAIATQTPQGSQK